MSDLVVKALAWAQMAGGQLPALPQAAHMTSTGLKAPHQAHLEMPLALPGGTPSTLWTCCTEGLKRAFLSSSGQPLSPFTRPVPYTPARLGTEVCCLCSSHTVGLPKERERAWREGRAHNCRMRFSGINDCYQILRKPMGAVSWDELEWGSGEPCFNTDSKEWILRNEY